MRSYNSNTPWELDLLPPSIKVQEHPNFSKFTLIHNEAQKHISELNGMLARIKNANVFLNSFYLHESIKSSAVEHIETELSSVLDDSLKKEQDRSNVNKEVLRYRQAILKGWQYMFEYSLTTRTINIIHKDLIVKGNPGEYRKIQNKIVSKQGQKETVLYTPPSADKINGLISNWEKFVHSDDQIFWPLLKTIICHYQFEAIHPFEDGNGRTGRILIVLQLVFYNLLNYPVLFISDYLNQHSDKYKKLLLNVTKYGHWWEFIEFMLNGYIIQAKKTKMAIEKLENTKKLIKEYLYSNHSKMDLPKSGISSIIDHIFEYPHTNSTNMAEHLHMSKQTCAKYLNNLSDANLLTVSKVGRNNIYVNVGVFASLK